MSEAKMGAKVMFCGHEGWFVADIWRVGNVNVVYTSGPVSGDTLVRGRMMEATHHMVDLPQSGFWKPNAGTFVVPEAQVTELPRQIRHK